MQLKFKSGDKVKINFSLLHNLGDKSFKRYEDKIYSVKEYYSVLDRKVILNEVKIVGWFYEKELILISIDNGLICKKNK